MPKVRALAVHGGDSNVNVLKFQSAALRKAFGKDVEWIYPEGLEPGHPTKDVPDANVFHQGTGGHTPFEERLAGGKPFVSWWKYELHRDVEDMRVYRDSWERVMRYMTEFVHRHAPLDVAVGFGQGAYLIMLLCDSFRRTGEAVPWAVNFMFSSNDPNVRHWKHMGDVYPMCAQAAPRHHFVEAPLPTPTFVIGSHKDPLFLGAVDGYSRIFTECEIVEHEDGFGFPTSAPRAAEIYERLALEFQLRCGLVQCARPPPTKVEQERKFKAAETEKPKAEPPRAKPPSAAAISAVDLAELLMAQNGLILETRPARPPPLPGVLGSDDTVSLLDLKVRPGEARERLARLVADGRKLVVVSPTGEACREYCAALLGDFGLKPSQVCRLNGGVSAWKLWELEHWGAAAAIYEAYGLCVRGQTEARSVAPGELARLLQEGRCAVADAREPAETRGRVFPGAQKHMSFLKLRRTPREIAGRLEQMLDGELPVVVVSVTGLRSRRYCSMLVDDLHVDAARVFWLEGGIHQWEAWGLENKEVLDNIRRDNGLPAERGRPPLSAAAAAAEREHSLEVLDTA